jgi:rsbT co-antagonist protein RsbR
MATAKTPEALANELWTTNQLLDRLGLFITEVALESREKTISRQQTEMLELSTPVVKLWDGILALPLIGTLDSERTQIVMENLLQEIVRTGAGLAIIDITGVPTVDTLVAQHLLKTVAAARLMGAECIISGIRPQIASTIVHLGVDLGDVSTKATLADAFAVALRKLHLMVARMPHSGTSTESAARSSSPGSRHGASLRSCPMSAVRRCSLRSATCSQATE